MSLLPSTVRLLALWSRTCPRNPVIRERTEDDRAQLDAIRAWLETRPHTAECRCTHCRSAHAAA